MSDKSGICGHCLEPLLECACTEIEEYGLYCFECCEPIEICDCEDADV